jgi:WD40 repeat protein
MALDINDRYVATVTGERKLYVLSVESGKPFRICKPETADEIGKFSENSGGSLINIDLDPFSGTYAVTSGSDRCIRLFDLTNSTCIEKICAHSEVITSVKFIRTTEEDGLRVVSTCSDGTIFIWKVSREIIAKMAARRASGERDVRSTTTKLQQKVDDVALDKRATMLLGLQDNHNKRIRRVSTATAVRPTASISQMIRQGERKTFSTMSPAEQKYDDVYRKIAASSGRRNNTNDDNNIPTTTNNLIHPNQQTEQPLASPTTPTNKVFNSTRNLASSRKSPAVTDGRKSPGDQRAIGGKLDRLYNGLPTSRERTNTNNLPIAAAGTVTYRQQQAPPTSNGARNPILRRAISRDALNNKADHRKSPTKTIVTTFGLTSAAAAANNKQQKEQTNANHTVIGRRSSQPVFNRRKSDPQQQQTNKSPCKILNEGNTT